MRLGKYVLAAAALTMSVAPAIASQTNAASSLSVAKASAPSRASATTAKDSDLAGGSLILALLAAAAVIAGIIAIADGGNGDSN